MTQEQIDKQIEYLRSQKVNPTGNYRRYLVNLYIICTIMEQNRMGQTGVLT